MDSSGNVFLAGQFAETPDFDPGSGTANLTDAGSGDGYVVKLDSLGNYQWAVRFGSTGADEALSLAVDGSGNVFVAGYFNGTVDFDPGTGTASLTSAGAKDAFVLKLDSTGKYVWAYRFGSTGQDDVRSLSVDGSGNVLIGGIFTGTVDFDPGAGTVSRTSNSGSGDAFVTKWDTSGTHAWTIAFGGTSVDLVNSVVTDGSGNVFVTGSFTGLADFDPGTGTASLNSRNSDGNPSNGVFVAKYNSSGAYVWAKGVIGRFANAYSVRLDGSGNVLVAGTFTDTVDFNPDLFTATNLTSVSSTPDIFVLKLDSSGAYVWVRNLGGAGMDIPWSMSVDGSSNVVVGGYFSGTVDFDPGAGTANRTSTSSTTSGYVLKLNSSGAYQWAATLGTSGSSTVQSVFTDESGNVIATGYFLGTVDFDPGAGTANLSDAGNWDVFVLKLGPAGATFVPPPTTTTTTTTTTIPLPYPDQVGNLVVATASGQARTVTLSFTAPSNAERFTLSGYLITYRCLTKTAKSGPCTGKWRRGSSLELDNDSTTDGQLVSHTFQLPAGIAGDAGRAVSFRVIPVADDDDMTLGPTSDPGSETIRDTPVLVSAPLAIKKGTNRRIRVTLADVVVSHTRGSAITEYVVEYSRTNESWFAVAAPTGGWGPGKSKVVTVPTAGEPYFFRLRLATNSGTVVQSPPRSQISS